MSAYISFYIKSNSNEFIPIGTFSRASDVFQIFEDKVSYGKNIPVTNEMLDCAIADVNEKIKIYKRDIQTSNDMIISISAFSNPIEEKIEQIYNYRMEIKDMEEAIEDAQNVLTFIGHLTYLMSEAEDTKWNFSEKHKYDATKFLWVGYEAEYPGEEEVNE